MAGKWGKVSSKFQGLVKRGEVVKVGFFDVLVSPDTKPITHLYAWKLVNFCNSVRRLAISAWLTFCNLWVLKASQV